VKVLMNAASAGIGGALNYTVSILREFSALAEDERFLVILPPAVLESVAKNVDHRIIELLPCPVARGQTLRRMLFDSRMIRRLAKSYGADVLFSSTGFGTLRAPCPQILLVRNSAYFCPVYKRKYKELGKSYRSIRLRRWWSLLSMRTADVVLFPSEAMRALVAASVSLDRMHTRVLHYGFDAGRFFQPRTEMPQTARQMEKWREDGFRIALHVSSFSVQKNLEILIKALPAVIDSGIELKLVTTVDRDRTSDKAEFDAMTRHISELGLSDAVVSAGHLDHSQLHYLYERADVFVFPSFTESFGHPLVEAMASGLPVVASDTAVNREILQDAAVYFDTFDAEDLADKLETVIRDKQVQDQLSEQGRRRSNDFSWEKHVRQIVDLLSSAL